MSLNVRANRERRPEPGASAVGAKRFKQVLDGSGTVPDPTPGLPLAVRPTHNQQVGVKAIRFGATVIMEVAASPGVLQVRAPAPGTDEVLCYFVRDSPVTIDGRTQGLITSQPGSCWLGSGLASFSAYWSPPGRVIVAKIPRQVLVDFGIAAGTQPTAFRQDSALLAPVAQFLESLVQDNATASNVAAYFMEKLVHEMLGGLFLEHHGAGQGGRKPALYDRAMAFIAASAGDPTLTPQLLAQEFNVSLRQLQREFHKRGVAVAEQIRQGRIDLALRLLTDPAYAVLSLEQVAANSGFASLGHLRRTLQAAGYGSPRDVRSLGGPAA